MEGAEVRKEGIEREEKGAKTELCLELAMPPGYCLCNTIPGDHGVTV